MWDKALILATIVFLFSCPVESCETPKDPAALFSNILNSLNKVSRGESLKPQSSPGVQVPRRPQGFYLSRAYNYTGLAWNWPGADYRGHDFTRIYRHDADDLSAASVVGETPGSQFSDRLEDYRPYYYWITHVNVDGIEGPPNCCAGTLSKHGEVSLTPETCL